jgi:toxin ParE1/3/4
VDYKVTVSPQAAEQLIAITAWIARDNPDRAESFGKELLDRINILATFPSAGSNFRSSKRFRKLVAEPYLIVYRIDSEKHQVEVVSFRHGRRNPRSAGIE